MDFQPGQIWKYRTREEEENSKVTIIEIDETALHIYVDELNVTTPKGQRIKEVYIPIAPSALVKSVTELAQEQAPNYQARRKEWLESHDTRGQGFFTMELSQFLTALERANSV